MCAAALPCRACSLRALPFVPLAPPSPFPPPLAADLAAVVAEAEAVAVLVTPWVSGGVCLGLPPTGVSGRPTLAWGPYAAAVGSARPHSAGGRSAAEGRQALLLLPAYSGESGGGGDVDQCWW